MALDLDNLPAGARDFLTERHLATLTTIRPNGSPHVVPVGFTWDPATRIARVITSGGSAKARHAAGGGRVALCQVDGARWLTLEGWSSIAADEPSVADGVARYTVRYRQPRPNPARVVIVVQVDVILGSGFSTGSTSAEPNSGA